MNIEYLLGEYVFWYPLIMSMFWIIGGLIFYYKKETKELPHTRDKPYVSVLLPCYNEEANISDTIENLNELNYPEYEIIAVNDGSKDTTALILKELCEKHDKLRVINLKTNSGKANALYLAVIASKGEIVVTIDADSLLDKEALNYIIPHFTAEHYGERVGAVTGNPRIRNRSSLLAKIQICEFSSIIGLIKRTQRILGKVMTVSGVVAAFRKKALLSCGFWDRDLITDDIGVTWKLERNFWDVRYEPRAICWMLVPETIRGYWKQRVRWAQGGLEVMMRHFDIFFDWKQRRLIPVYLEQITSILWALSWLYVTIVGLIQLIIHGRFIYPVWWSGAFLSLICLVQFLVAMIIERRYDKNLLQYYFWAIWYPILYWYFNALVILWAIPKALKSKKNKFAVWESPDRGLGV
jgi:poly-beta-1,6-N-acetyl-D-glucosamine synthase